MMTWEELHRLLNGRVAERVDPEQLFNAAPTNSVLVALPEEQDDRYHLATMEWGLKPEWARSLLINAQAEKYLKPGRNYWAQFRRCLIPASGFYEWKPVPGGGKQPMYIRNADRTPFVFAGLYQIVPEPGGAATKHCVILTTRANELMTPIHNRMPAILRPEQYDRWIDPDIPHTAMVELLEPYPADLLEAYPVSRRVNDVRNRDASLVEPAAVS